MSEGGRTIFGGAGPVRGLRVPQFDRGWGPGFGCEGDAVSTIEQPFNDAYQLTASPAGTSTGGVAVDDEWFAWDPEAEGDGTRITIKQPGFYLASIMVNVSEIPAEPWLIRFEAGNSTFYRPVPPGFLQSFNDCALVALDADYVVLQTDLGDNVGLETVYRSLIFVPLFEGA